MLFLFSTTAWATPQTIIMWHSFPGDLGQEITYITDTFNKSQSDYRIKPIYKGEYIDVLTSFAAAFRAHEPPAIVQIFEVGTAAMLNPPGIIKPLDDLLKEQDIQLPLASFIPTVREFYSKEGRLQALPFNTSIPVMYYNADALAASGVTADSFPKTWDALEVVVKKLKKSGYACAYTSAYPTWIHIESFLALHGLPMVGAHQKALYNNKSLIKHVSRLKTWQNKHYFEYGGRANDATILFTSGRCPLFSQSSGSYKSLEHMVTFRLGVALMPIDANVNPTRQNNVFGGGALWAVAGLSNSTYRGIALFYRFMTQPDIQEHWHQHTGYLPLGFSGVYKDIIAHNQHPTLVLAQKDLGQSGVVNANSYAIPQNQIRMINDEALEAIFSGIKLPTKALNDAVERASFALLRFARNTKS